MSHFFHYFCVCFIFIASKFMFSIVWFIPTHVKHSTSFRVDSIIYLFIVSLVFVPRCNTKQEPSEEELQRQEWVAILNFIEFVIVCVFFTFWTAAQGYSFIIAIDLLIYFSCFDHLWFVVLSSFCPNKHTIVFINFDQIEHLPNDMFILFFAIDAIILNISYLNWRALRIHW